MSERACAAAAGRLTSAPVGERVEDRVEEDVTPEWVVNDALVGRVVVSAADIRRRVKELGAEITRDYAGRPPLLVGVLKGAFVFLADLARAIKLPVEMDFMAVASYGTATKTSGVVRIVKDLDLDLSGRHVIVVEDIVDSGLTLSYLRKSLLARGPESRLMWRERHARARFPFGERALE